MAVVPWEEVPFVLAVSSKTSNPHEGHGRGGWPPTAGLPSPLGGGASPQPQRATHPASAKANSTHPNRERAGACGIAMVTQMWPVGGIAMCAFLCMWGGVSWTPFYFAISRTFSRMFRGLPPNRRVGLVQFSGGSLELII